MIKITAKDVRVIRIFDNEYTTYLKHEFAKEFDVDVSVIEDVLKFKNKTLLKRYQIKTYHPNSRNRSRIVEHSKYCCREPESHIRDKFRKLRRKHSIKLSKKFGVSTATIRDILANRSWDYGHCRVV